jgi:hypothetical protein
MTWTRLSPAANSNHPAARSSHGFTSAGGKLYVHGGDASGNECEPVRGVWCGGATSIAVGELFISYHHFENDHDLRI